MCYKVLILRTKALCLCPLHLNRPLSGCMFHNVCLHANDLDLRKASCVVSSPSLYNGLLAIRREKISLSGANLPHFRQEGVHFFIRNGYNNLKEIANPLPDCNTRTKKHFLACRPKQERGGG